MYYNDDFKMSFIHLHKCGGTTIRHILQEMFDFEAKRAEDFQAHDGVNDHPSMMQFENIVSVRNPVDIYCSKYSHIIRLPHVFQNHIKNPPDIPINTERIKENRGFLGPLDAQVYACFMKYYKDLLELNYHTFPRESGGNAIKRDILNTKFPTGVVTHQFLFQTCIIDSRIHKYSNIYDFFINQNIIDHVIRHENLIEDLESLFQTKIPPRQMNKTRYTQQFKDYLTEPEKQAIEEKEELFFKFYKGELDDYLRRYRRNNM